MTNVEKTLLYNLIIIVSVFWDGRRVKVRAYAVRVRTKNVLSFGGRC